MMQAHPIPNMNARGGLPVENVTGGSVAVLGACERANQIQLRAGIDYPANATKNSIHFAERSESIDVNWYEIHGLQQQFFVAHEDPSPWATRPHHATVALPTQTDSTAGDILFCHTNQTAAVLS